MTKAHLIDAVYARHGGISRREAAEIVDLLLARIKEELLADGDVRIAGFGSFRLVSRQARRGRNPRTGEPMRIGARRSLVFRPSPVLLEQLN